MKLIKMTQPTTYIKKNYEDVKEIIIYSHYDPVPLEHELEKYAEIMIRAFEKSVNPKSRVGFYSSKNGTALVGTHKFDSRVGVIIKDYAESRPHLCHKEYFPLEEKRVRLNVNLGFYSKEGSKFNYINQPYDLYPMSKMELILRKIKFGNDFEKINLLEKYPKGPTIRFENQNKNININDFSPEINYGTDPWDVALNAYAEKILKDYKLLSFQK